MSIDSSSNFYSITIEENKSKPKAHYSCLHTPSVPQQTQQLRRPHRKPDRASDSAAYANEPES